MSVPSVVAILTLLAVAPAAAYAHDGPPFPIVSDHTAGPYRVSIWTDPDTTDDGSAGGQFWVMIDGAQGAPGVPAQTRATVAITPLERDAAAVTMTAAPVRGDVTNQFAALVMDHEGRFAVRVTIAGPLGEATVSGEVDATYDLRPAPVLLALYMAPFLLVGVLWTRLVLRRRAATHSVRGRGRDRG